MRLLPFLLLSLSLSACGGGPNPDKEAAERIPDGQRVGAYKAEILAGAPSFANGSISGSGTVRFAEPLGTDPRANFSLSLELAEGQAVTLIAFANRDLTGGVELELARPAGAANPKLTARAGGDTLDLSGSLTAVNATLPMSLAFDVHKEGDSSHLVLFDDGNGGAELGTDILRGKGLGANWGLRLAGGKVTALAKSGPRDNH